MIDAFIAAVQADGGQAARVPDAAAARTHVAGLLGRDGTLCFWSGDPVVMSIDPASLGQVAEPATALFGITGATFGVMPTGTLVLTYGTGARAPPASCPIPTSPSCPPTASWRRSTRRSRASTRTGCRGR